MLPRIDTVPIERIVIMDENGVAMINDEFKKWVTNLVDTLNAILDELDSDIAAIDARLTACGC